jgi:YVTN family beta-propeller protein
MVLSTRGITAANGRASAIAAAGLAVAALLFAAIAITPRSAEAKPRKVQDMVFVGSNWDGTVDVLDPDNRFRRVARLNVIPDLEERLAEISTDPVRLAFFLAIREFVGEGNDQYVDDMYTSKDGRLLIASRPSLADVVALSLRTGQIVWRFEVDGQRSDHMAISPDGKHVAVSASTGNVVHILDVRNGQEVGRFPSGDSPHENTYSEDGERIYHASIGRVYTPTDQPEADTSKGERYFQVVDADTFEILKRIDMGQKLEEAGYPDMSAAVRPMALGPNERFVYFQVSFFHGFVEYDLRQDRVTDVVDMPISKKARNMPREQYLLDSAHHGIAMNHAGSKLCVAGTMSDYAAIVSRRSLDAPKLEKKILRKGEKPYWATTSDDGRYCFVSWSESDAISVIRYKTRREVAHVTVGNHPQRIRMGHVRTSWIRKQRESAAGG